MTQTDLEQIKQRILPILKKAGVTRSSLFGSYVRGDSKNESDIDILVDLPREKSLFDFIELQQRLENVLHKKVDLGEYSTIKPQLEDSILKEAVQIL